MTAYHVIALPAVATILRGRELSQLMKTFHRRARTLGGALILITCLCFAGFAVASTRVYILTITGPVAGGGHVGEIRPAQIKLFSGSGLTTLRWSSWGGGTAQATGYEVDADKSKQPVAVSKNPVTVRATKERRCGSRRAYSKLHVHFTMNVPRFLSRDATYDVGCPD